MEGNERTVGEELEALPPKHNALLETQADSFKEESVLQATVVLQVAVFAQLAM